MKIILHTQPLSINKAFQGRRFKTKLYKVFEKECLILLPKQDRIDGWVGINYEYGLTKRTFGITDVGNLEKCLSDILVKKGYIEDDRKILILNQKKLLSDNFYVIIDIYPIITDFNTKL